MKLKNRKTGEIIELELTQINDKYLNDHELERIYGEPITLEVLNKYCEDYQPTEPLIKDEKIRKVVRAWADMCGVKTVRLFGSEFRYGAKSICFGYDFGLEHLKLYTITELCGEDEE